MLGGALAPIIVVSLLNAGGGDYWPVVVYIVGIAAISAFAVAKLPETRKVSLDSVD